MKQLTPSEALFGFCAWLTSREPVTIMSSVHDCSHVATLIDKFCEVNRLEMPEPGWIEGLTHPDEEDIDEPTKN
jgi:hypothetical protein